MHDSEIFCRWSRLGHLPFWLSWHFLDTLLLYFSFLSRTDNLLFPSFLSWRNTWTHWGRDKMSDIFNRFQKNVYDYCPWVRIYISFDKTRSFLGSVMSAQLSANHTYGSVTWVIVENSLVQKRMYSQQKRPYRNLRKCWLHSTDINACTLIAM